MRKVFPLFVIITIALLGCGNKEQSIMDKPENFTVDIGAQQEMFYPAIKMASFNRFVAISDNSRIAGNYANGVLYSFDLANGKHAWKKEIEKGYHGKIKYAGLDGFVFAKLDGKLTCLDLVTGKTIWQSKESIDWVEKAAGNRVYCVSTEENRRNDDSYRNLLSFDVKDGKNIWSVELSTSFTNGYYGVDEVAYFDWLEDGRNLLIRDAKTGQLKQKIQGADLVGENIDKPTNVLYRLWNDLFMHTPDKEMPIFKFGRIDKKIPAAAVVLGGKLLLQTKNDLTQIIELETGKILSEVPEILFKAKIMADKAFFDSSTKFNAYDVSTGKLLWFLGKSECSNNEAVLVPADNKTLNIHSIRDGSLVSQVKLESGIYRSAEIDGFGFVVSTENGKLVFIKTVDSK